MWRDTSNTPNSLKSVKRKEKRSQSSEGHWFHVSCQHTQTLHEDIKITNKRLANSKPQFRLSSCVLLCEQLRGKAIWFSSPPWAFQSAEHLSLIASSAQQMFRRGCSQGSGCCCETGNNHLTAQRDLAKLEMFMARVSLSSITVTLQYSVPFKEKWLGQLIHQTDVRVTEEVSCDHLRMWSERSD